MKGWYVWVEGAAPIGPFPAERIRSALGAGALATSARVCRPGAREWRPILSVPEVAPTSGPTYRASPGDVEPLVALPLDPDSSEWVRDRTNLCGLALVASFLVPWAYEGRSFAFTWTLLAETRDVLGKLLLVYPALLGVIILITNRARMPAAARGAVWSVLAFVPCVGVAFLASLDKLASIWLPILLIIPFGGSAVFAAMHPRAAVARWAPVLFGALLAIAYVVPAGGGCAFVELLRLTRESSTTSVILGWLSLLPLLYVAAIVLQRLGQRSADPERDRSFGGFLLVHWGLVAVVGCFSEGLKTPRTAISWVHPILFAPAFCFMAGVGFAVVASSVLRARLAPAPTTGHAARR